MGPRAEGGLGVQVSGAGGCSGDCPRLMGKPGGQEGLICAACRPARTRGPALKVGSRQRLRKALQKN